MTRSFMVYEYTPKGNHLSEGFSTNIAGAPDTLELFPPVSDHPIQL